MDCESEQEDDALESTIIKEEYVLQDERVIVKQENWVVNNGPFEMIQETDIKTEVMDDYEEMSFTVREMPEESEVIPLKNKSSKHKKGIECPTCSRIYKNVNSLKAHQNIMHKENRPKYSCSTCNNTFMRENTFKMHSMKCGKTKDVSNNFICNTCGSNFKNELNLKLHKRYCKENTSATPTSSLHHDVKSMISESQSHEDICSVCSRKFYNNRQLQQHLKTHTKDPEFTCTICEVVYKSKEKLNIHMKMHSKESTSKMKLISTCTACKKNFNTADLEKHMKECVAVKLLKTNFSCTFCEKVYESKERLKEHSKECRTVMKIHRCVICNCTLSSQELLHKHFMACKTVCPVITKAHEENRFVKLVFGNNECPVCFLTFNVDHLFQSHLLCHVKKKITHECSICKVSYNHISDFMKYQRVCSKMTHPPTVTVKSSSDLYKCTECFTVLKDNMELQKHMKEKHMKQNLRKEHKQNEHKENKKDEINVKSTERQLKIPVWDNCFMCKNRFSNKDIFERHVKACKTVSDLITKTHEMCSRLELEFLDMECPACLLAFRSLPTFRRHLLYHVKGSSTCDCYICGVSYNNGTDYMKHQEVCKRKNAQTEPLLCCSTCGCKFQTQHDLNEHKKSTSCKGTYAVTSKSGDQENFLDSCKRRQQTLEDKPQLLLKKQKSERIYNCNYCDTKSNKKYYIDIHMISHIEHKPSFLCQYCKEDIMWKRNMPEHKKVCPVASKIQQKCAHEEECEETESFEEIYCRSDIIDAFEIPSKREVARCKDVMMNLSIPVVQQQPKRERSTKKRLRIPKTKPTKPKQLLKTQNVETYDTDFEWSDHECYNDEIVDATEMETDEHQSTVDVILCSYCGIIDQCRSDVIQQVENCNHG